MRTLHLPRLESAKFTLLLLESLNHFFYLFLSLFLCSQSSLLTFLEAKASLEAFFFVDFWPKRATIEILLFEKDLRLH